MVCRVPNPTRCHRKIAVVCQFWLFNLSKIRLCVCHRTGTPLIEQWTLKKCEFARAHALVDSSNYSNGLKTTDFDLISEYINLYSPAMHTARYTCRPNFANWMVWPPFGKHKWNAVQYCYSQWRRWWSDDRFEYILHISIKFSNIFKNTADEWILHLHREIHYAWSTKHKRIDFQFRRIRELISCIPIAKLNHVIRDGSDIFNWFKWCAQL